MGSGAGNRKWQRPEARERERADLEELQRQGYSDQFTETREDTETGEPIDIAVGEPAVAPVVQAPRRRCGYCNGDGLARTSEHLPDEWDMHRGSDFGVFFSSPRRKRDRRCPVCLGKRQLNWMQPNVGWRVGGGKLHATCTPNVPWIGRDQHDILTGQELHELTLRRANMPAKRSGRVARNKAIRERSLNGAPTSELADAFNLSERHIRRIANPQKQTADIFATHLSRRAPRASLLSGGVSSEAPRPPFSSDVPNILSIAPSKEGEAA